MEVIQSPTAEIMRGKKEERKKIETAAAKYNDLPITMGRHNEFYGGDGWDSALKDMTTSSKRMNRSVIK